MIDHLKKFTLATFVEYLVYGIVLALLISVFGAVITPVVKLIPVGTMFSGTISLTDMLLFVLILLTIKK